MFQPTACLTPQLCLCLCVCCALQGAFAELWEAQGIAAGDTLVFKRDPHSRTIELSRMPTGSGPSAYIKPEEVGAAAGSTAVVHTWSTQPLLKLACLCRWKQRLDTMLQL